MVSAAAGDGAATKPDPHGNGAAATTVFTIACEAKEHA